MVRGEMVDLRRFVLPGLWLALAAGAGCHGPGALCPKEMHLVSSRSVEGQVVWCQSADGRAAQWIEVQGKAHLRRQVCEFHDHRPDGPFLAFHPDGKHWIEGAYSEGVKDGRWRQWDKSGSLVAEGDYRAGRLVSGAPVGIAAHCETINF
jgi:hypothetical protein